MASSSESEPASDDDWGFSDDDAAGMPDPDRVAAEQMALKFAGGGTHQASTRLARDLQLLSKNADAFGFRAHPVGDNLYVWHVLLHGFEGMLDKDLSAWSAKSGKEKGVHLQMVFPGEYPMAPPFVRVLYPRFQFMTGHITTGGSVCMELLTRGGWSPVNTIESVLVQVRTEILSDPKARLDLSMDVSWEYSERDAKLAFDRMCAKYGW